VADVLGLVEQTLGNWVRPKWIGRAEREGLSTEERWQMGVIMEHDLLKRSVAFWVKELDW
jgi:hypothetical protein